MSIFEGFEDNLEPLTPEQMNKELVQKLLDRARNDDHSKFEFIKDLNEYSAAQTFKKAVAQVAKSFYRSTRQLLDTYFKQLKEDVAKVELLVAAKDMEKVAEFYKAECALAGDMIDEYQTYLSHGHTIDAFMGKRRVEQDLYDFRKPNSHK